MRIVKILLVLLILVSVFACEDILEVPDISGEKIQLLAPSDSTVVGQNPVNFSWNEIPEATQYVVQIAIPNFNNASQIVLDTLVVVDTTYRGPRLSKSMLNESYEWRVKARNSDYETDFTNSSFSVNATGN